MHRTSPDPRAWRLGATTLFAVASILSLWSNPAASAAPQDPSSSGSDSDTGDQRAPDGLGAVTDQLGSAGDRLGAIANGDKDPGQDSDEQPSGATSGLTKGLGLVVHKFLGNAGANPDDQSPNDSTQNKNLGNGGEGDGGLTQAFGSILGGVVGTGPNGDNSHPENQLPQATNNGVRLLGSVLGTVQNSDLVHNVTDGGKNILDGGREDPSAHHDDPDSDGPDSSEE